MKQTAEQLAGSYYVTACHIRDLSNQMREIECPHEHLRAFFEAGKQHEPPSATLDELEADVNGCEDCSRVFALIKERKAERKNLTSIKRKIYNLGKRVLEAGVREAIEEAL